jgi:hypothetical protein
MTTRSGMCPITATQREQRKGAVVGQDDAKDMAHDNGGGLEASDQAGIVHDAGVDARAGGRKRSHPRLSGSLEVMKTRCPSKMSSVR